MVEMTEPTTVFAAPRTTYVGRCPRGITMRAAMIGLLTAAVLLVGACAQVPKESVQLSATVGRDISEIEKSHLKLLDTLFDRYEADANKVIDQLYTPFYIQKSLEKQGPRIIAAIQAASRPGALGDVQKDALDLLQVFLEVAHEEIEGYRKKLLTPLLAQRRELREKVTSAYDRVQKANAIVTGHLASVVKVTELQNDLLAQLGLPKLQEQVAMNGEKLSTELGQILTAGQAKSEKAENLVKRFEDVMGKWRAQ